MGSVFCKIADLSSTQGTLCTVSVFLFYILLIWGCVRAQRTPPAYGPEDSTLGIRMRGVMGMNVDWNGNDPYYHVGKFQRICAKLHSLFHRD